MTTAPPKYSIQEIKDMLLAQVGQVAYRYAPPAGRHFEDKGKYFTLNPGRPDKTVGSFYVQLTGPKAGNWTDHATGEFGDILDLIGLSIGTKDAGVILREARTYLGLRDETDQDRARRAAAVARAKADRERAAAIDAEKRAKRADQALAIWLDAQPKIKGTPVEFYLRDTRGIDLARIGRQPRALRFSPDCYFSDTDPDTGEHTSGKLPAMVALVNDVTGKPVAVHRTYLAQTRGQWHKARLSCPKKVLGDYAGAAINIWSGTGPRGGKPSSLPACPPDTRVFITEGIEDALSAVTLIPHARIIAAISLSNIGGVQLPDNVSKVTLIADLDENDQAQAQLQRAIGLHVAAGRKVHLWQNQHGGKDLNDLLAHIQGEN